jgi:hypothetical protein
MNRLAAQNLALKQVSVFGFGLPDSDAFHALPGKVTPSPACLKLFDGEIESADAESYLISSIES